MRLPPLVVVAVAGGLMWLVARTGPLAEIPGKDIVSLILAGFGLLVCVAGVVAFRRARTTVNPLTPDAATALVTGGVYSWTRNPMYLGFALALLGWAVWLASPLALVVLVAFVLYMNRFQISPEEQALERLFGVEFTAYKRRVRRWL